MSKVEITDTSKFDEEMKKFAGAEHPVFVLFTGAKVASTGQSWCPDCIDAHPYIERMLTKAPEGSVLVTCPIPREGYRGNPNHVYRKHKSIRLKGVPTLGKWINGRIAFPLLEQQICDDDSLKEWLLEE